jgi:hypothetical protein
MQQCWALGVASVKSVLPPVLQSVLTCVIGVHLQCLCVLDTICVSVRMCVCSHRMCVHVLMR